MNRNNLFEWSESEGQLFTTLITQMGGLYTDNPQGEYKTNTIDSFINEASGVAYTNLTSPNGYSKSGNIVFGKGFVEDSPSPDPKLKIPFYVENIGTETNTFGVGFKDFEGDIGLVQLTFEISEDGQTWIEHTIDTSSPDSGFFTTEFTEKIYVRANTTSYSVWDEEEINGYSIMIGCMNPFNVGGNTMSLLYGSDFTGDETSFPEGSVNTFSYLFKELPIVSAENLMLPATTLTPYCYYGMFGRCELLEMAPELPATTLASYCYEGMFYGCTSLTSAPELPATTLAESCYNGMFNGCESLTSAPQLPATELAVDCYIYMFQGCTSLESVIVHVTGEWDTVNTEAWLSHVAPTGILYNLGNANGIPENDSSGCPYGWTIETGPEPEPPHPETLDWFYVEDISGTENVLTITANYYDSESLDLSYSYDKISWTSIKINASHNKREINFPAPNTKIYLRAKSQHWGGDRGRDPYWASIDCEEKYSVGGNIMSLLFGVNFSDKTILTSSNSYAFSSIFSGSGTLSSAENLILPATTLTVYCYSYMFSSCTSLTTAPELPATTLAEYCYYNMFSGCTSLTEAPELPANTLVRYCYGNMFSDCTSLTEAPELPATTLVRYCYGNMFSDCTSLTEAPELPATTLAEYCYYYMFSGCTSLTKAPELPATRLVEDCYNNMFFNCDSLNSVIVHVTGTWDSNSTFKWLENVAPTGTLYNLGGATDIPLNNPSGCPSGWFIETSE